MGLRGLSVLSRAITVVARVGCPLALVVVGVVTGRWIWVVVAVPLLAITLTIAWTTNEHRPEGMKRNLWWP
jgi:hypothetical protein